MRTPSAPPYLLPPEDVVSAGAWEYVDGGEVGDRVAHWDAFTDLSFSRTVRVDLDATRSACGLAADSAFALGASAYSNRTRLTITSAPVELGTLAGRVEAPLTLVVHGAEAGGRIDVRTRLVLRAPGTGGTVIAPRRAGSILWTDESRIALEGSSARFPVSAIDFSATTRWPDGATWALDWNSRELEAPVLGGMRLLVNSASDALLDALRSGSHDARAVILRNFVTFDVARALVHGGLAREEFVAAPEAFDEGSVGRLLFELITATWPGAPVPALAARSRDDPARLDAELQAHLGTLT